MKTITLEISAESIESCVAAERGGAHRVELCSDLLEGGVTPSAGLITTVRRMIAIELYVMIRPRGGDFCYSADEFGAMKHDVEMAKRLGANGVVFGILREHGTIDIERTRVLVELARPMGTTFHRAFDMSRDLRESLEDMVEAGVDRVLTSGGEQSAEDGCAVIGELVKHARGRVAVMAGSGVRANNVGRIIESTGVREIHSSAKGYVPSPMKFRNEKIAFGPIREHEYERAAALESNVRAILKAATSDSKH